MASSTNPKDNITTKSQVKENAASRKKVEKSLDHLLKALSALSSPEEKLAAMCNKYAEMYEDNLKMKQGLHTSEKQLSMTKKERDILQTENNRALLAKSKLESLCRELQRQNKIMKEEFELVSKNEDVKRKHITEKFQTTIVDIQNQMTVHYEKSAQLHKENENLTEKIKDFYDEYKKRETEYETVLKHNAEQLKFSEQSFTKVYQQNIEITKENTMMAAKLESVKIEIEEQNRKEEVLQNQIKLYTEKYSDFQLSLNKSNDIFKNFQGEMNKATKQSKKLQKENFDLNQRCETNNSSLIEMAEIMQSSANQKSKDDTMICKLNNRIEVLEKLCRALQQRNGQPSSQVAADHAELPSNPCQDDVSPSSSDAGCKNTSLDEYSTTTNTTSTDCTAASFSPLANGSTPSAIVSPISAAVRASSGFKESLIGINNNNTTTDNDVSELDAAAAPVQSAPTSAFFVQPNLGLAEVATPSGALPTYDSGIFCCINGDSKNSAAPSATDAWEVGVDGATCSNATSSNAAVAASVSPRFTTATCTATKESVQQHRQQRETRHKRAKEAARKAAQMSPRSLKRNAPPATSPVTTPIATPTSSVADPGEPLEPSMRDLKV